MPRLQRTEIFEIDIDKFYNVIVDYRSYPRFVEEISKTNILRETKNCAVVEYSLNIIKDCNYVLELFHQKPYQVKWKLKSGDIFKINEGSWNLEDLGNGKTKVTYSLEVDFRGYAPRVLINKLLVKNIPEVIKTYYNQALKH